MGTSPRPAEPYVVVESIDDFNVHVTTIKCHGRIVSDTAGQLKDIVKPLIPAGGRIVIDLTHVEHIDSSGLGALVGLKASALNAGYVRLELVNLTPRVADLLKLTKLTQLFAS